MPLERQMEKTLGKIEHHHKERYKWASGFAKNRNVVDAACGCGYGALILSGGCKHVVGLDRSAEAITHARRHYCDKKITYRVHDIDKQGFKSTMPMPVELLVSLETVEHLSAPINETLKRMNAALTEDGIIVFSHPALEKPNDNFYHKWFDLDPDLVLNVTKQAGFDILDRWTQAVSHKKYTYHLVAARRIGCPSDSTSEVVGTRNQDSRSSI